MISLIIPVYNAESSLKNCLESVLSQSYTDFEVILINDGSSDASERIINEFLAKDPRCRYFYQSNAGPSTARNKGIDEAKRTYLAFADADDWLDQDYLKMLIEGIKRENADLACAGYYEVNSRFPKGLQLHDFNEIQLSQKTISQKEFQSNLFNGVAGVLWAKLFKKEIFENNSIQLHKDLRLSEDLLTVLEYSTHVHKIALVPESLYYYNRQENQGLSGLIRESNFQDLQILIKELEKYKEILQFTDLGGMINKRKQSFYNKFLKDHSLSKLMFYDAAQFLRNWEASSSSRLSVENKRNALPLKWVLEKRDLRAWLWLKANQFLRNLKNG